ncbi:hypothetical protein ACMT9Y_15300 [Clavibacter tessellarius]|uniref:hypothetical protein n=1 Tax=Clavibacter tessellarius TaxID=31965 RepID=UPI0039EC42B7
MDDQNASASPFGAATRASDYVEDADAVASPLMHTPASIAPETAAGGVVAVPVTGGHEMSQQAGPVGEHRLRSPHDRDASASVLFKGLAPAAPPQTTQPAKQGFRGFLAGLGLPVKPGAAEAAALAASAEAEARRLGDETTIRQATWTRAVSILVANPKGGTGKTPTTLALGGVIASIRGGSTAIIEVSDDPGALNFRAEGTPRLGIGELVRDVQGIRTAGQLTGYTAPQTSFANVIGSTGRRERLTGDDVVAVSRVIDEFYGIRVMDSGNQPTSTAFRGAVSVADVLVIPVLNAGDSVLEAIQLLEELRADGGAPALLADRAVAIRLTDGRPENDAVRAEVSRLLLDGGVRSIHEVPYDRHIAERGQLTLASLDSSTRDAFASAAAAVVRILQEAVAPASNTNRKA